MLAYVRARAADGDAPDLAVRRYSAALALSPGNQVLAARALDQGLAAGDEKLALASADILDAVGKLPPQGRMLLVAEALRGGRWQAAGVQARKLRSDRVFAFAVPILEAWAIQGGGAGDPLALLDGANASPPADSYVGEQRALLFLARGRPKEGAQALASLIQEPNIHADRLRIAAGASLARSGDAAAARAMLRGDSDALARARASLATGHVEGEIRTPAQGLADFLLRIAVDLNAQQAGELAVDFARIAAFAAPGESEAWLLAAELLGQHGRQPAAMAALAHIAPDDPFAGAADERRLALLLEADRKPEALARARAAAVTNPASVDAWVRLGDVLLQSDHKPEAAAAFERAITARREDDPAHPRWGLLLLEGNALSEAGKWAEAKAALEEAYRLAPHQASLLNYLGYSELERRENLVEAERLIREASALQPDDAAITDSLGWTLYVGGRVGEAVDLLEKAARGQPADPAINEHLGDAYYSAGRRFEARYAWRAALVSADSKASARLQAKIDSGLRPDLAAP